MAKVKVTVSESVRMTSALVCGVLVFMVTVVTGDDVIRPPSILQGPERVIIFRRDEAVNLTCVATGRPDTITCVFQNWPIRIKKTV